MVRFLIDAAAHVVRQKSGNSLKVATFALRLWRKFEGLNIYTKPLL